MKIGIVLDQSATSGGGFNQSLNAVLQIQKICKGKFEIVVMTNIKDNLFYLNLLGIKSILFKITFIDYVFVQFLSWYSFRSLTKYLKWISPFEKQLLKQEISLIYFVTPSFLSIIIQKLSYIITVWDLCHRDMPEFPEVSDFSSFHSRERLYKNALAPAVLILTDSSTLANKVSKRYGIDDEKILPMPFLPAPLFDLTNSVQIQDVLLKYKLLSGYFFYPAQFWPHKNHIRILEALLILQEQKLFPSIVFAGADKGNLTFITKFIELYKLYDQVKILGFVPSEDMASLYMGCKAVIMPSYFGPTNLPPLEAWMFGRPLIYNSHFQEQSGDAAILIDPNEANDIAEAIKQCFHHEVCNNLIKKGYARLECIKEECKAAELALLDNLLCYEKKTACWR
jgi:glycosyltransferase involved in cell wall biosynthesis